MMTGVLDDCVSVVVCCGSYLDECCERPPAAVGHHVTVQAAQPAKSWLIAQLLRRQCVNLLLSR